VFTSVLGITAEQTELLRRALFDAAANSEAMTGESDQYGQRYVLDFAMTGPSGSATVRSLWIVLAGEDFPRMITCYIL